jgi:DNA-binding NarL/FixJ family response regulator
MSTERQPINVLIVDDHTILRQGLKQLLEIDKNLNICGEAENGEEAILKALSLKPDIILMDINLPKVSGYEASRAILTAWPQARILVLTNQDDAHVIKKFMDLGIPGFLLKDVQVEILIDAIHQVVSGKTLALSPELAEKLKTIKDTAKESSYFTLTEREKEVLKALTKCYSNLQLAELLMVSPKTVHNHLYNIYSKIGVSTRAEAIVWAIESGFSEK